MENFSPDNRRKNDDCDHPKHKRTNKDAITGNFYCKKCNRLVLNND